MKIIPKRDELSIKIDDLSAIFETIQAKELIERIMGLPSEIFHVQKTRMRRLVNIIYSMMKHKIE